jgi:hypothetical protein
MKQLSEWETERNRLRRAVSHPTLDTLIPAGLQRETSKPCRRRACMDHVMTELGGAASHDIRSRCRCRQVEVSSGGMFVTSIVSIAWGISAIKRRTIVGVKRKVELYALRKIGVGNERSAERNGVRLARRDSGLG